MSGNTRWVRRWIRTAGLGPEPEAGGGRRRRRSWWVARHRLRPGSFLLEDRCLLSTFTVTSTDDSAPASSPTPGTLRWAVEQADASTTGATINFNLTTPATITLAQGPLDLDNQGGAVDINGPGAGSLTVSGGGTSEVFTLVGVPQGGQTVSISDLTIAGGSTAGHGGGILNYGFMTLTRVTISGNTAGTNGGGIFNRGWLTLLDCTISGNSATGNGGGLDNNLIATLIDSTIADNAAGTTGPGRGGGLNNEKIGWLTLTGCSISGNTSGPYGGGLNNYATLNMADCTISGNTAGSSGSGFGVGGGLENERSGTANLTDCTLNGNYARVGGGLNGLGTTNLTDCTVIGNSATYSGGVNGYGTLDMTGCTVSGNSASAGGGGVGTGSGKTSLTNCTIFGNTAAVGGGLSSYGPSYLTGCTVSGNTADSGGGVANYSGGFYAGTAALTDTIVAGNTAPGGAANDVGGNDPGGVTGTYNLIGDGGSGGITGGAGGNVVGVADPGLAALADNGGLAQTMALQTGSPAIGAGIAVGGLTTDQRGLPRPTSGAIDIGAFETQSVSDSPPIAAYQAVSLDENAAITGQVSATDADGNPLTYSVVAGPADGTLTLNSDGWFTYTPNFKHSGPDSFTFEAFDGIAYSNVATVSIVVYGVNLQPPVANNDSYATPQNTALSVSAPGVLGNDTDPLGKPLTAVRDFGPSHGTLAFNSDGSFAYTPATGFYGIDTFTYEASDGQLDSTPATVTLTVGTPPVANDDTYGTVPGAAIVAGEGPTLVTMTSQPGDFVGDGQSYSFGGNEVKAKVLSLGSEANTVEIDIATYGQNWTLDFQAPNQAQLVPGTYTGATRWPFQAAGVPGLDVSGDGRGGNTITGQFTVSQAVYDGSGNIVSFVASFVQYADGSGAALSGQVEFNDTLGQPAGVLANDVDSIPGTTLTATLVSGPSHGTLSFNSDGSFSYNPTLGFDGIDTFTYQDHVGTLAGNVATVTIGVFDQPAVANDVYSTDENTALTVSAPGVLGNDTDLQGLPLTAVLAKGPSDGTLAFNGDGSFIYTPAPGFFGTDFFRYYASNGFTESRATVTITVVQVGQAAFLRADTTTQGTWMGTYGADGYNIIGDMASYPSYATVTSSTESAVVWAPHTDNVRALQMPGDSRRIAAAWYDPSTITLDVNLTDGNAHDLELYFLDWDSNERAETVQVSDAVTGTVLDTEQVASFHWGVYLDWQVSGPVVITITKTAGADAVLSGIFFDPTAASSSSTSSPAALTVGPDSTTQENGLTNLSTLATATSAMGTLDSRSRATIAPPPTLDDASSPRELVHDVALERVSAGRRRILSLLDSSSG